MLEPPRQPTLVARTAPIVAAVGTPAAAYAA
jgi:hypothetical protein